MKFYFQLTEVEQAFRDIKHDLAVRPIYHQLGSRIEAHIFVAFLACCLQVTLKAQLRQLATASGDNLHSGLTAALPKATFEAFGKLNGTL